MIRERMGGIVATCHDAPVAATGRFDTSADKLRGMLLHDAPLPRLEDNRSQMLPAGAVRRKRTGQAFEYALTIATTPRRRTPTGRPGRSIAIASATWQMTGPWCWCRETWKRYVRRVRQMYPSPRYIPSR